MIFFLSENNNNQSLADMFSLKFLAGVKDITNTKTTLVLGKGGATRDSNVFDHRKFEEELGNLLNKGTGQNAESFSRRNKIYPRLRYWVLRKIKPITD